MRQDDKQKFVRLVTDVMAFYRQDVSEFAVTVWWQACESFDFEQVAKALTAHAMDPDRGQFAPKPADLVRLLQGTKTDRARIAWGKVLDAMQRVGAYESVAFDDPVIHAAIEDIGGWVAICRGETKDLPHVERRFCESYRAYANHGCRDYPAILPGAHQIDNALRGKRIAPPKLIGNPSEAQRVMQLGMSGPKTQITHISGGIESAVKRIGAAAEPDQ